jgi:hypothetical protein
VHGGLTGGYTVGCRFAEAIDFTEGVNRLNNGKNGTSKYPGNLCIGFGIR